MPTLLTFLLVVVSGWVHRRQLLVIEFLQGKNRLWKGRLRGKRIRFIDAERALLARKVKALGRKALMELARLFLRTRSCVCIDVWLRKSGTIVAAADQDGRESCGRFRN